MGVMNSKKDLASWEDEHHNLSVRVDQLERRAYLTPDEQRVMSTLKKRKLAAKDRIFELRRAI